MPKPSRKDEPKKPPAPNKKRDRYQKEHAPSDDDADDDDALMPAALTRKIVDQAREQQLEVEHDEAEAAGHRAPRAAAAAASAAAASGSKPRKAPKAAGSDDDSDGEDGDEAELQGAGGDYYEDVEPLDLSAEDQRALDTFMGGGAKPQGTRTLADVIMGKINEANAGKGGGGIEEEEELAAVLPPKVIEVYAAVGKLLHTYRSGKLPKAFKVVPRLANWEEVLYATEPELWSPAATREATRLFASNLNPKMAQRFFNLVLLPAVQDDIKENGKLNFHLYLALKKALYKPSAFFKGVLLPLAESRCTIREALIVSSVLQKVSVPMLHSAVAILKLAEMDFTPANALFMRTMLLKKYALPYRVVDALVEHFAAFRDAPDVPPVLWQQTLLAFVQHYKAELTAAQHEAIKAVLRAQFHPAITPEIRRELVGARARGDAYTGPA